MQRMKSMACALGTSLALAPALACAQAGTGGAGALDGTYSISALKWVNGQQRYMGCVVRGADNVPKLVAGNVFCRNRPRADVEHRWHIYPVGAGHVIMSVANGGCLIRGNNGKAGAPQVHHWRDVAYNTYCGLRTAQVFGSNGQASWYLDVTRHYTSHGWAWNGRMVLPAFPAFIAFDGANRMHFSTTDNAWSFWFNVPGS